MKQPTTRRLYQYWNEVRGRRMAPSRFEIEPSRIASVLSETFIIERAGNVERAGPDDFGFRLAGTRICEQFGRELRGTGLLDLVASDKRAIAKSMDAVTLEGAVLVFELDAETADGRRAGFEGIVLPLVHPVAEVTRYLGALTAIDPPLWLGFEPIAATWLVNYDVVRPDGLSGFAAPGEPDRQLPFSPQFAAARIVRSARRQFRILDGGRKG
jgi:hypothetical protein